MSARMTAIMLATLSGLASSPLRAATQPDPAAGPWIGVWELSLLDTERKCSLSLRADVAGPVHQIGLPPGCRRAMPMLATVGGWLARDADAITLESAAGQEVLSFARSASGDIVAQGPQGEIYQLVQTGALRGGAAASPRPAAPATSAPVATLGAAPLKPFEPPKPATNSPLASYPGRGTDVAGRYLIMREGTKDVGCMLTFEERAAGPHGSLKAQLAPACRDQGIVVFDPVGWQFARGQLLLTARKGHQTRFEYHQDGSWWKDPKDGGKPLGLRKM